MYNSAIKSIQLIIVLIAFANHSYGQVHKKNNMYIDEKTEEGLLVAINRLIEPDDNFSIATLDSIYHDDMVVIMFDEEGNKNVFNKEAFKILIASKLEDKMNKKNSWAKFLHVELNQEKGHIVVKRRVNLTETKSELTVILDFVWEDDRWQIIRENIFSHSIK